MEVFLCDSTVCRLCGEENDNGTFIYTSGENIKSLSEVINTYLPIKVADDGQLPRIICPGCTIQLEATVEFLNLIVNGQKVIRELHERQKEYKKTVFNQDNIGVEVDTNTVVYQADHPIALQMAGLDRPRSPAKKLKSPEELAQEIALQEQLQKSKQKAENDELTGKRRCKTPTRFMEVVQGEELEIIFKEEVMTDDEVNDICVKIEVDETPRPTVLERAEIIEHKKDSGELMVTVTEEGRGKPKEEVAGSLLVEKPNKEETAPATKRKLKCNFCDKLFSSKQSKSLHTKVTHYGERRYACIECGATFGYPRSLALHKLSHRRKHKSAREFPCDLCGKVLHHPSSVVYHKEAEHAGQCYVCNECGKSFKHKQLLARHQRVHSQLRPFNCKICDVTFKTKQSLLNHHRSHTNVKKYSCEICNDKFTDKTSQTLHMRLHNG